MLDVIGALVIHLLVYAGPAGGASDTVAITAAAPAPTGADRDFAARCAAPGVVKCMGFDSQAQLDSDPDAVPVMRDERPLMIVDSAMRASGAGSLRFEIPTMSSGNTSGFYKIPLGEHFAEGDTFYVQFRQRFSKTMVVDMHEALKGGNGWKQFIIHPRGSSCASLELTMQNTYMRGYPQMYTACGAVGLEDRVGRWNYRYQQGDYNCYRNTGAAEVKAGEILPEAPHSCGFYTEDNWITFYLEVSIGTFGQPNSQVRAYMGYEGGPLKKFVNQNNFTFSVGKNKSFDFIQLTPYHTDKSRKIGQRPHPSGFTWYDELIISTQPIAAPGSS